MYICLSVRLSLCLSVCLFNNTVNRWMNLLWLLLLIWVSLSWPSRKLRWRSWLLGEGFWYGFFLNIFHLFLNISRKSFKFLASQEVLWTKISQFCLLRFYCAPLESFKESERMFLSPAKQILYPEDDPREHWKLFYLHTTSIKCNLNML